MGKNKPINNTDFKIMKLKNESINNTKQNKWSMCMLARESPSAT